MRSSWALTGLVALATAAPSQAEWLRARSRHFVIYSDTRESELREMATRLEHFDGAMRKFYLMRDGEEEAANPLTIYVADGKSAVERLAGRADVAGFYQPRATGAIAFTPRRGSGGGDPGALKPQTVLFHEYAHHLLLTKWQFAVPAWYSEGSAEFVATALVTPDFVQFGHAANHRAQGLGYYVQLPLTTFFAPPRPLVGRELDQLYGRGWLLTHYTASNEQRRSQLVKYLNAFATGTPPLDAARQAFGDLKQLDRELDRYMRGKLYGRTYRTSELPTSQIDIRPLSAGERALIDLRMASERGVDQKTAAPLYARALKASVPAGDAVAQGWLAEMAYDARQDDAAEAAADRALAADPKSTQALLYKARVRLRRAAEARSTDPKVWGEARSWIVKANRIENNNAAALSLYHESFAMAREKPSEAAVAGLHRALELVPQAPSLRFASAQQDLRDRNLAQAKRTLMPLAYSPHVGPNNPAATLIALIDSGKMGEAAVATGRAEGAARKD